MPTTPELPPRPQPPRRAGDIASTWLRWFGVGRMVAGAVSVLVVVGGAAWLLRLPSTPAESDLPVASAGSQPSATLPPPTTSAPIAVASTAAEATPTSIVVHVAGAVTAPGVYVLTVSARVASAVDAAGGPAPDGDLDRLNLAAPLVDGQRVYVPRIGELDPASVPSGVLAGGTAGGTASGTGVATVSVPAGPVDVNTATAADLEALPGVGPATAAAIVDDRTRNGPFATVDDLDRVTGIGPAKLASLRDLVTV